MGERDGMYEASEEERAAQATQVVAREGKHTGVGEVLGQVRGERTRVERH